MVNKQKTDTFYIYEWNGYDDTIKYEIIASFNTILTGFRVSELSHPN